MIAVCSPTGSLVRCFPNPVGKMGYHTLFGFISEEAANERLARRKKQGLSTEGKWIFQIGFENNAPHAIGSVCKVKALAQGWELSTPLGTFSLLSDASDTQSRALLGTESEAPSYWKLSFLLALVPLIALLIPSPKPAEVVEEPTPEILVQMPVKKQVRQVYMQAPQNLVQAAPTSQKAQGALVRQKLGFLEMLGKPNLTQALGGIPKQLAQVSPGAGPGGTEGSGGETLTGLGTGVRRTTVGNTGVQGLGGVGSKGAGGGAGGYGLGAVGSGGLGAVKNLSALPLSQDMVLEGGLEPSVIRATIAKYLSQVRACYEEGLRKNAGLSGQVSMAFEINAQGMLNFAKVAKTTLGDAGIEGCIGQRMLTWQFPKPLGGVNVKVVFPFLLRPVHS